MNEPTNVKTVQHLYQAFGHEDIPSLLSLLSDNVEWFVAGPREIIPFAGKRQGRAEVAQFYSIVAESVDVLTFEPHELIAQGDKVIALGHERARAKATQGIYETDWAHIWTIRSGKIERLYEFFDTAAIASAFGRPPEAH